MCNKFRFTDEEIDRMLELPRPEDLTEINNLKDENDKLKDQIEAFKHWIKYWNDVDMDVDALMEWEKEHKEETKIMTPEESEYHIRKIEVYSDIFNYGRVRAEEKKVAESL